MKEDYQKRFKEGKSLLYLCIEVDIPASVLLLEDCMGYLEPSAVGIIQQERRHIRIREEERAARGGQVPEGGQCRNANRHQRNLAGGGGYSGHLISEGPLGLNSQGHPRLPPRPEFPNSSNARSAGRRNGARSGYPARVGAPTISPHALRRIETHMNQDPDGNCTGDQSRSTSQDRCAQNRPQPGQGPYPTWVHRRDENPTPQNTGRLQTHSGRSPHHYQIEGRVNKNGSQKRRERHAREKLSRY